MMVGLCHMVETLPIHEVRCDVMLFCLTQDGLDLGISAFLQYKQPLDALAGAQCFQYAVLALQLECGFFAMICVGFFFHTLLLPHI